ncbi:TonB-linked SusC/RagA family outer membrane protein [Mucilaginibacter oryzae]|uniref:TonB-linked SusC/RagA family outer membrane protein n=1 Tax=Mucilaginibacter oryzae TaxID=468058 RepID=A0A316HGR9_9SPHI|nr:TonB-dependent receptor [Mucilaginibacter oryzae]PWK79706.1 TonB-linked SusC/RagA family outer membrane protein [Mucilaginibacter oryzae]
MKLKYFLLIISLSFVFQITRAQNKITINGKVTDARGEALPGVSVSLKGTTTATATNLNGQYIINADDNGILVFSFLGFLTQEVPVNKRTALSITLETNTKSLNEVVVTGYQTERKKDLTGSVAVVDVTDLKKQTVANPMKALQGQVPGVYITGNGAPSSPTTIRIRGIGTLNNNDPLYIIDGVPTKAALHELNSDDIESMQILKDAASASVYGSRAANGVIVITTKHGKIGSTQVTASSYGAISTYINKLKMLDADGYGRVLWQANVNSGFDPNSNGLHYQFDWNVNPANNQPVLNKVYVSEYLNSSQTIKSANTDWFHEISQVGVLQNHDVQVSNGNDNGRYLLSLGYYDNKGIIKTTGFNRISARINSDYKVLNGLITIGENLSLTKTHEVSADIINSALQALPIIPIHTVDGIGWGGPVEGMNDRQNPVRVLEDNKQNGYDYFRLFGNFFADVNLFKGLTFRSNIGVDYGDYTSRNWQKKYVSGYLVNDVNKAINTQTHNIKTTWTNSLNYKLATEKHRLDVFAGTEYYIDKTTSFTASREGFVLEDPDYMYLDAGTGIKDNSGYGAKNVLFSYIGKANYSFMDRYLLSATVRYDGSSRFGKNNKYGTFPSFSAGWRLSEEPFFKKLTTAFDELKIRGSWGKTGNQEINNNAIYNIYLSSYNITAYDINGNKSGVLPSGFYLAQNANPNLKWEATQMTDLGLDFSLFNQKIYGSASYYIKNTSDILLLPPYIGVLGEGGNTYVNGASMQNKGFELSLGHRSTIGKDLSLDLTGNIDLVRNKVTKLPPSVINAYGGDGKGQNILGRTYGSFFGYIADGLFQNQAEVAAHATQNGAAPGRIRYVDLNKDGVINDDDRTWIGNPLPKFTYGFNTGINYKTFDLSFLLQGVGSVDVRNEAKLYTDFWSAIESSSNKGARLLNAWSPTNTGSTIPAVALTDNNFEARPSTYFIENGSYLKLRNAQVGYTLSKNVTSKIKIKSVRFYIGGDNLAILWKSKSFTGLDPESPAFGYPNPTVFTAGVNIKL